MILCKQTKKPWRKHLGAYLLKSLNAIGVWGVQKIFFRVCWHKGSYVNRSKNHEGWVWEPPFWNLTIQWGYKNILDFVRFCLLSVSIVNKYQKPYNFWSRASTGLVEVSKEAHWNCLFSLSIFSSHPGLLPFHNSRIKKQITIHSQLPRNMPHFTIHGREKA